MISVEEASEIILANTITPKKKTVQISEALGKILAENITADRDFLGYVLHGIVAFGFLKYYLCGLTLITAISDRK